MDTSQPLPKLTNPLEFNAGRYLLRLYCVTILPTMLAVGLIALVMAWSGLGLTPTEFVRMQEQNRNLAWAGPLQLWGSIKYARVTKDKPEIVVIGASRAGQIRSGMFKPYRFYNANMIGWTLERLYKVVDEISRTDPPRLVIFTLDYFMLTSNYEARWRKYEEAMPLVYGTIEAKLAGMKALSTSLRNTPLRTIEKIKEGMFDASDARLGGLQVFGPPSRSDVNVAFRYDGSMLYFPWYLSQSAAANSGPMPLLAMVDEGSGERIDPNQMTWLRNLAAFARQRGVVLVGVQLPLPEEVVSVLDGDSDFVEDQKTYRARDRQVWKEFETDRTRAAFKEMGIVFFDFVRSTKVGDRHLFADVSHPGEYLVLSSMIEMLKDPYMRSLLPNIDIERLESIKRKSKSDQSYFDIFQSNF